MGITFDSIPSNAAASAVFVEQKPEKRSVAGYVIPQKLLVIGSANSGFSPEANKAVKITSVADAYTKYGRGSLLSKMIERAWDNCGGVDVYALPVADLSAAKASAELEVTSAATSAGTIALYIGGEKVSVAVKSGDTAIAIATAIASAITGNADLPVTVERESDTLTLTAKFGGTVGNIKVEKDLESGDSGNEPSGVALTLANLSGGASDPSVATALANLGDTFYTVIACPYNDTANVNALISAGNDRAAPGVKRPYIACVGYTGTKSNYLTFLDNFNSSWVSICPVEAASSPAYEVAAAYAGRIAYSADKDPARPMKTLTLSGITGGTVENWTYSEKDAAVKAGGCWTKTDDAGNVILGDCITTYTKSALDVEDAGDTYRYVTTITKMQAKIYSLDTMFNSSPFDRAIIISDGQVSQKAYAISPSAVKAFLINLVDSLWIANSWSKDRDAIVAGIVVEIDSLNSSRINCYVPDVMSAELAIVGVQYAWAFSSAE